MAQLQREPTETFQATTCLNARMVEAHPEWLEGSVDTVYGIVAIWNATGPRPATGLRFIYGRRTHTKRIVGRISRRRIITEARRFAESIAQSPTRPPLTTTNCDERRRRQLIY